MSFTSSEKESFWSAYISLHVSYMKCEKEDLIKKLQLPAMKREEAIHSGEGRRSGAQGKFPLPRIFQHCHLFFQAETHSCAVVHHLRSLVFWNCTPALKTPPWPQFSNVPVFTPPPPTEVPVYNLAHKQFRISQPVYFCIDQLICACAIPYCLLV